MRRRARGHEDGPRWRPRAAWKAPRRDKGGCAKLGVLFDRVPDLVAGVAEVTKG